MNEVSLVIESFAASTPATVDLLMTSPSVSASVMRSCIAADPSFKMLTMPAPRAPNNLYIKSVRSVESPRSCVTSATSANTSITSRIDPSTFLALIPYLMNSSLASPVPPATSAILTASF